MNVTYRSCTPILRERINNCIRIVDAIAYSITPSRLKNVVKEVFSVSIGYHTVKRILNGEIK